MSSGDGIESTLDERMDEGLAAVFSECWTLLGEGARSRKSPMHTPALASIDGMGRPTQRVLVLRSADHATASLRFHTDARSPKVEEIGDGAAVHVMAYHPEAKIQLRLGGTARVLTGGDSVEAIWSGATLFARRCYLAQGAPGTRLDAPGSGLPLWVEGREPSEREVADARLNFAILMVDIDSIDRLHLANSGHRRAIFARHETGWSGQWVVP